MKIGLFSRETRARDSKPAASRLRVWSSTLAQESPDDWNGRRGRTTREADERYSDTFEDWRGAAGTGRRRSIPGVQDSAEGGAFRQAFVLSQVLEDSAPHRQEARYRDEPAGE